MRDAIRDLLKNCSSGSNLERQHSIGQLGFLLEKNAFQNDDPAAYSDLLYPEFLSIQFDANEQQEIVEAICQLIISDQDNRYSLFWALGKAFPAIAVGQLLALIHDFGDEFDPESCYQAMVALENYLPIDPGDSPMLEVVHQLKKVSPRQFLQEMRLSGNTRLSIIAERLIHKLRRYS
jgi:hypothetical protein